MKCPRCQQENPDTSNFCTGCGLPLKPVMNNAPRKKSKAGEAVTAVVKAVLYVLCFFMVETLVISFYVSALIVNDPNMSSIMSGFSGSVEEYNEIYQNIVDLMYSHLYELNIISALIALLLVSLFFTLRHKNIFDEAWINVKHLSWQNCLLMAVYGLALNAFVSITMSILPIPQSLLDELDSTSQALSADGNMLLMILSIGPVTAIVEETFYRGLAYTRLKRGFNMPAAVIIASLIFGISHGAVLAVIYASLLGAVICLVDNAYDTIVSGMIIHCFFNCGNYLLQNIEDDYVMIAVYCFSIAVIIGISYLLIGRKFGYRENRIKADSDQE